MCQVAVQEALLVRLGVAVSKSCTAPLWISHKTDPMDPKQVCDSPYNATNILHRERVENAMLHSVPRLKTGVNLHVSVCVVRCCLPQLHSSTPVMSAGTQSHRQKVWQLKCKAPASKSMRAHGTQSQKCEPAAHSRVCDVAEASRLAYRLPLWTVPPPAGVRMSQTCVNQSVSTRLKPLCLVRVQGRAHPPQLK